MSGEVGRGELEMHEECLHRVVLCCSILRFYINLGANLLSSCMLPGSVDFGRIFEEFC